MQANVIARRLRHVAIVEAIRHFARRCQQQRVKIRGSTRIIAKLTAVAYRIYVNSWRVDLARNTRKELINHVCIQRVGNALRADRIKRRNLNYISDDHT